MGKIRNNVVTKGFSGKFGDDIVFRQVDEGTVFAKKPTVIDNPTDRQVEIRGKFTEASYYAKAALDNPEAGQEYKLMAMLQGLKSAYLAAVTDFLTLPEIASVYTRSYKGAVGNIMNIAGTVPMKIIAMQVQIFKPDGTLLESGLAVPQELKWRYTATLENPQAQGSKLVIKASDRLGNETTFEKVL